MATAATTPSDEALNICGAVARSVFGAGVQALHIVKVARRLRSIGIELDVSAADGLRRVFVKVPRARGTLHSNVTASFTPEEREMAVQEYEALSYLHRQLSDDETHVGFVRPVALVEDVNALVLDHIGGHLLLGQLRRWDLGRRVGQGGAPPYLVLQRLGRALGRHHARSRRDGEPHHDRLLDDVRQYAQRLQAAGVRRRTVDEATAVAERARAKAALDRSVTGISGLHLHHFVVGNTGGLTGFDPGVLRPMAPEEDLARLLVGLECLYWSTPLVAVPLRPRTELRRRLLGGWAEIMEIDAAALQLCLIRQGLFRWLIALEGVSYRTWPNAAKDGFRATVLDPFFSRVLRQIFDSSP